MNPLKKGSILILLLLATSLSAQDDRYSEQDVQRQAQFIEANRERILGNYAKAIQLFENLADNEPNNPAILYELGRSYHAIDEQQRAIDLIVRAVALDPDNEWYAVYLADLYQATGQDNNASDVYEDLVGIRPEREDYYYKWAYFLVRANKASQALKVYQTMEKTFGLSEELSRRKHTLYLGIGDFRKAEQELINLVDAFPESIDYLHLLAGFYDQMEQPEKALDVYRRIQQLDPSDSKAAIALSGQLQEGNDDINYLRSLAGVFVKPEVELDAKMVQLIPFIQKVADTGDQEMATVGLELCKILNEVHPSEAKVYAATADLHLYSGDPAQALEFYERALKEDESVYQIWEQFLLLCAELNETEKLITYSESALDVFPNQAMLYYFNGLGYSRSGDPEMAVSTLEQAVLMAGRNLPLKFELYSLLGDTYADVENFSRSDDAYSRALELNPNAAKVLRSFSYSLAERAQDLGKAKDMAARANELQPNKAPYLHTYGWVLYRLKEYRAARDWISRALDLDPTNAIILEHQGDIHYQLGLIDEAMEFWQRAADEGGASDLLDRKIADRKLYE